MFRLMSKLPIVALVAATACGGGDKDPGGPSGGSVLTTLVVSPTEGIMPNTPPGNTLAISVSAKDQNGATMTNAGTPIFTSSNNNVASVNASGIVTSHAVGTATITASLSVGSVTRTGTTTINVEVPGAAATVTAPLTAYEPSEVHIIAGGTVTWVFAAVPHTVTFTAPGSPSSVGEIRETSAARSFPQSGTFPYQCAIHANMRGNVHVH